jgi:hypothetical protein
MRSILHEWFQQDRLSIWGYESASVNSVKLYVAKNHGHPRILSPALS